MNCNKEEQYASEKDAYLACIIGLPVHMGWHQPTCASSERMSLKKGNMKHLRISVCGGNMQKGNQERKQHESNSVQDYGKNMGCICHPTLWEVLKQDCDTDNAPLFMMKITLFKYHCDTPR